ncbi:MAG: PH domain-containing protein [Clostridia bacterium]|nr:PH domain-containing protein [Clostridia bacterium]
MEYKSLSKKARQLMGITALLESLLLLVACLVAVVAANLYGAAKIAVMAGGAAVAVLWAVFFPMLRFKRYKYLITEDRVEIVCGVLFVSRTVVPINRIHQINVVRGPLDSTFGVAKVSVITAGSTAVLRFLEEDEAQELALHLNERVRNKLGGGDNVQ